MNETNGVDHSQEVGINLENLVEAGNNKNRVKCPQCPSVILAAGAGQYHKVEFDLPKVKRTVGDGENTQNGTEMDELTHFWRVDDIYIFENIGFSHTVGDIKYLACADCEVGPIGYYDTIAKLSYVALARVASA